MKSTSKGMRFDLATILICLLFLAACSTSWAGTSEKGFSIAVLADPRSYSETWKNALSEIRDMKTNPAPGIMPAELLIVAGDIDPLASRYLDFQQVFNTADSRPLFLPVIGNHEFDDGGEHFRYARETIIPSLPNVVRRHATSTDYYIDHKNIRIIVIDGYTDLGKYGVINEKGRQWVEQIIMGTPSDIDHIIVSFHEPAFPRFRHTNRSFDRDPGLRNDFWRMLLKYREKVHAVFVGHTHAYYRMRILDPGGIPANDTKVFPDEDGGIYQIDAGAAGNGSMNTIVQMQVEGKKLRFRTLQAKNGAKKPFTEMDRWEIVYKQGSRDVKSAGVPVTSAEDRGLDK